MWHAVMSVAVITNNFFIYLSSVHRERQDQLQQSCDERKQRTQVHMSHQPSSAAAKSHCQVVQGGHADPHGHF